MLDRAESCPPSCTLAAPNVLNVAMQSAGEHLRQLVQVGQLGTVDLAALALVFPTQMALGQMSAGAMGGGISSSVARALGRGDRAAPSAAAAHALAIALGMAALFAVVFVGFGRSIYGALGGSGARSKPRWSSPTCCSSAASRTGSPTPLASVLRGTGDMKTPGFAWSLTAAYRSRSPAP